MPEWLSDLLSMAGMAACFAIAGWALLNDEDDLP